MSWRAMLFVMIICVITSVSSIVFANITVSQYQYFLNEVPQFKDYLTGVGQGAFWAKRNEQKFGSAAAVLLACESCFG